MQRYILDNGNFYKEDLHHIKNVMRFKTDDEVILCNDRKCFVAKLIINEEISYQKLTEITTKESLNITLIQGNLKGTKLETTIKYATIFGASEIIITDFERSIAKISNVNNKISRYFKIAKEAAELAHRSFIPEISFKSSLKQIDYSKYNKLLLADEDENVELIINTKVTPNDAICLVVGPEGGISSKERKILKDQGFKTVSFGPFIYPAEIAAISALTTLNNKIFWHLNSFKI